MSLLKALLGEGVTDAEKQSLELATLSASIESTINSYDDAFDQLPEMVQNALDSIIQKYHESISAGITYKPKLTILIDEENRDIGVLDNGVGVPQEHFHKVFRPNVSVKRLLKYKNQRGHKGAAVVYLQFDHGEFEFQVKDQKYRRSSLLRNGNEWIAKLKDAIENGVPPPQPDYLEGEDINPTLESYESGAYVRVKLADEDARALFDGIFSSANLAKREEIACKRLEYILRTRTGIGYVSEHGKPLPDALSALGKVKLEVRFKAKSTRTSDIPIGFWFPHEAHPGPTAEIMNKGKPRPLEILYQSWAHNFFQYKEQLKIRLLNSKRNQDAINKFQPYGYFSYTSDNLLYESIIDKLCDLGPSTESLENGFREYLKTTGINGGFLISVDGFPNGRLHQFIQRGGSEDKSRSFVIVNFNKNYTPDYGRKSLHHDCRGFVNDLCKGFMALAGAEKKDYLRTGRKGGGGTPGPSGGLPNAKESVKQEESQIRARYQFPTYISGSSTLSQSPLEYETEVAYQFIELVRNGTLKGFKVFGIPTGMMFDGLFDYDIPASEGEYHKENKPLGLNFGTKKNITLTGQWLEFKKSADLLRDDFVAEDGAPSKKWFELLNLLVCDQIDTQIDDYSIDAIEDNNVSDRFFYGATHIMRKDQQEHTVQIICLSTLRSIITKNQVKS
jgi:hypothetical protein